MASMLKQAATTMFKIAVYSAIVHYLARGCTVAGICEVLAEIHSDLADSKSKAGKKNPT